MSYKYESVVNVIGHINPDTDSVLLSDCICESEVAEYRRKIYPEESGTDQCRNAVCVEAFWCVGTRLYGRCPDTGY